MLITQSVDNIVVATEAAFFKALLVTNNGSIIPALNIFTIFPVTTFTPTPFLVGSSTFNPAFCKIVLNGAFIASCNIFSPTISLFNILQEFNKAIPPPGTIPSFIAALVAQIASSTLSCFSFNSIAELAPTLITAT